MENDKVAVVMTYGQSVDVRNAIVLKQKEAVKFALVADDEGPDSDTLFWVREAQKAGQSIKAIEKAVDAWMV